MTQNFLHNHRIKLPICRWVFQLVVQILRMSVVLPGAQAQLAPPSNQTKVYAKQESRGSKLCTLNRYNGVYLT